MGSLGKYILLKDTRNPILRASVGNSLQLWLDASDSSTITESGGKVSQWDDKSGKGNNALQGTGADQPTFVTNHINGKSVLTFNGIVEEMDLTSDVALTGEFTMFLVANNEDTASTRVIFGHDTDNNKIATLNPTKAFVRIIAATAGDSSQDYLAENSTGIQIIQRNSSDKIDLAFNGTAFARLFSDVAQSGASSWSRIGVGEGTSSWKGDIAEIIIYNRTLTSIEITNINRYLATKWAISISAPDNIGGLQLWLDANDSSTITESGGKVSQWNDKSGQGNDATQGTESAQLTTGAETIDGKNVLVGDGSADFMTVSSVTGLNPGTGGFTVFTVHKQDATGDLAIVLSKGNAGSGDEGYTILTTGNVTVVRMSVGGVGATDRAGENITETADAKIIGFTMDGSNILGSQNGTNTGWSGGGAGPSDNIYSGDCSPSDPLRLFRNASGNFFDGVIGEVLVYNRLLSSTEIASVNTYLSNKYGITLA